MHAANRHVERWAPESSAHNVRSMRSLGFVDRLVAPWLETAQRSTGLRMFTSAARAGGSVERETPKTSWLFPRPWYQDELDWMTAAREVGQTSASASMLTTRGTYVAPQAAIAARRPDATVMPSALYEYVAPSLSIAPPSASGEAFSTPATQAYSPLVSLAAVQAAELMSRAVAPLVAQPRAATAAPVASQQPTPSLGRITPALRTVLSTMLERASAPSTIAQTATRAPEMVTPPAPRADDVVAPQPTPAMAMADQVATDLHAQRVHVAQVQAIAQRELATTRALEVQATAQRAEAELRQRVERSAPAVERPAPIAPVAPSAPTAVAPVAASPVAPEAERVAVERARIEDRVLQRVAERVAAQRLHEQSRAEAVVHARSLEPRAEMPAAVAAPVAPPPAILAAIAALPPQLAGMLSEDVLQQPGGALRAITQVNEALRTAELIARGAATNSSFEPTRGPRVMMPAGLGGLVATVDRAHGPTMAAQMMAPQPVAAAPAQTERAYRVPTLPWIAPSTATAPAAMSRTTAPTSALAAASTAAPQSLTHVAWADRWLARFAGASPRSLETIQAASSTSPLMHLASAAPAAVFVSPTFDTPRAGQAATTTAATTTASAASMPTERMPRLIPAPAAPIQRFDDNAETPDDVFTAIAASASRARKAPVVPAAAPQPVSAPTAAAERATFADHIAHAAPTAPGAGLSAQLASSPFAPALRHVLALPSAATFDIRSLFGSAVSATYLAGLLAPSSHEMSIANPTPAWASWSPALAADGDVGAQPERSVPGFNPAYVSPELAAEVAPSIGSSNVGELPASAASAASAAPFAQQAPQLAPLTTLRSALLSWTTDAGAQPAISAAAPSVETATSVVAQPSYARSLVDSMSRPMISETEASPIGGWTSPGAIADRAFGYSLAHERSTADLSFDFVPPELVLAARVYGLGPAEAAQAARLALAGPGQLVAMANTVDRTFVNAMAIEAQRRQDGTAPTAAAPAGAPSFAPGAPSFAAEPARAFAPSATPPTVAAEPALFGSAAHAAFGVDRRTPRGAFLWPSATVAALGLTAAAPDGEQSMSVAALELLAAQAVAEIGTYAALDDDRAATPVAGEAAPSATAAPSVSAPATAAPSSSVAATSATSAPQIGEPGEEDVLGAASALVAPSRRARFDALYVALSQAPSGKSLSPAARAARALALAGRGDDAPASAYERAAAVWDVLPVVYATEGMSTEEAVQTQAELGANTPRGIAARAALRRPGMGAVANEYVAADGRPGLSSLASRAGEALGGYVTSVAVPSVPLGSGSVASASRELPIAQRAPSAAQEMVQTGRPAGRHGGGEPEIPSWFEAAARKMLGERMGTDGISMAELTLVNAAAPSQIAAASRSGHVASAPAPASASAEGGDAKKDNLDVDAIADEVFKQIMIMMDAARARNGEPYL